MSSLDTYLEQRLISLLEDNEIIRRAMNHTFAAQSNQNLGFSVRVAQKNELKTVEADFRETIKQTVIEPIDLSKLKL